MKVLAGVQISRPEYDALAAVRATELKMAAKSLYHFNEYRKGNRNVSSSQQKGWDLGSLSHALNLENDMSRVKIFDVLKKDGSEYSVARSSKPFEEMVDANPNHVVVTKKEFKELCDKRSAFWACKDVVELMQGSIAEVAFCAQDPITGLWLKCQADFVNREERRFGDFKGCPDASEYGVSRMAAKAKWPIQVGHYAYVIELATGVPMERFHFIGQEFKAPHYTEGHELSQMDFENCRLNYRELLNRLAVAIKENEWPGYKKRGALVLPPWAYEFEEIEEGDDWGAA